MWGWEKNAVITRLHEMNYAGCSTMLGYGGDVTIATQAALMEWIACL